jgi:putative ABC transport system permease protein
MFKNYFKTAIRNLFGNKIYSLINIAGLSLGLACAMLIILYIKDELSYDRFHANANHIYRVISRGVSPDGSQESNMGISGFFQGPHFTAKIPEIKSFVRLGDFETEMQTREGVQYQAFRYADPNFFQVFSFPLLQGDPKTALSRPLSIVISEDIAERQFGQLNVLGRTIMLREDDQFVPYTVTGVSKRCPQNSSIKFEGMTPIKVTAADEQKVENWFSFFLDTYLVLDPRANPKIVEDKMLKVFRQDAASLISQIEAKYKIKYKSSYLLEPLPAIHLDKDISREDIADASNPVFSYIMSGIALFILLIACINFINLTIARSLKRAKEIGIRKVNGGTRNQLILQFLGESFLLCLGAFLIALALVKIALPVFNRLSNKALALSYLMDTRLILGFLALFLMTTLLAGFYPALVLSKFNPVKTLYGRFTLVSKNYLQKILVVLQFSLASFLILGTFTIYFQFKYLTTQKLGYDDKNLVVINNYGMKTGDIHLFKEEMRKNPDILGVAPKNNGFSFTGANINGGKETGFAYATVDESYLPILNIPVVEGRNFSSQYASDPTKSVLVNEKFVKDAGWKNPIGQLVQFNYDSVEKYTVIGVIRNYHFLSLYEEITPELLTMRPANGYGTLLIKIRPGTQLASLQFIEKAFKQVFPMRPYSYAFRDEQNLKSYEAEAKWKQIILFGALFTIFISCIGLFGLSVFAAEKRTKEIGIRKVLGASLNSVVGILSRDFLVLVLVALLLSLPLSWIVSNKWLGTYPYHIGMSWWMFAGSGLLVLFIALATVSFQAIRAGLANPVISLRTE